MTDEQHQGPATPPIRLLLLACIPLVILFTILAQQIAAGGTFAFDSWLLLQFREAAQPGEPVGPAWLHKAFGDLTVLGGGPALTLLTVIAGGYFLARRRPGAALVLVAAAGSAAQLNSLLKHRFLRDRPAIVPHLAEVSSASFPSAHAMNSAAIYLTLAALLTMGEASWPVRRFWIAVALLLVLVIGTTRLYLGVHWPSDVLAGWCLGASWAACWAAIAARWTGQGVARPG